MARGMANMDGPLSAALSAMHLQGAPLLAQPALYNPLALPQGRPQGNDQPLPQGGVPQGGLGGLQQGGLGGPQQGGPQGGVQPPQGGCQQGFQQGGCLQQQQPQGGVQLGPNALLAAGGAGGGNYGAFN